jgi:hypothetical protein
MEILNKLKQKLKQKQIEITSGWDSHEIVKFMNRGLEVVYASGYVSKYFFYDPKSEIYIGKHMDGTYWVFLLDGEKKVEILNQNTSNNPKGHYTSVDQVLQILEHAPKIIESNHKWHKSIENSKNRPKMSSKEVITDLKSQFQKIVYGHYRIATRSIKYSYDSNKNLIIRGLYHNIDKQKSSEAKYTKNGTCYNLCYLWHKKCRIPAIPLVFYVVQ